MKKLILGILVICGLAVVGYGAGRNLKSKGFDPIPQLGLLKTSDGDKTEEGAIRTSIKALLAKNKPVKCIIKIDSNDENEEGKMTGVTYVANNKMRSDVKIESEGEVESFEIHTISDGEWIYTWSDNDKMPGMKMKISELEDASGQNLAQELKDLEEEHDYHCSTWFPVDKSKFVPSSDIEFKDMTEMMKGFQGEMQNFDMEEIEKDSEEAKAKLCEMCEMAPTQEARDECRASAGCE